eukprot:160341-Chlamydomonas_euryale.AAC.1
MRTCAAPGSQLIAAMAVASAHDDHVRGTGCTATSGLDSTTPARKPCGSWHAASAATAPPIEWPCDDPGSPLVGQ